MKGYCNPIHRSRIVRNRPFAIRIRILLQHLANDGTESIHGDGQLQRACGEYESDSSSGSSVTSIQIEIDRVRLARETCGTQRKEGRPNLSASWARGRSMLNLEYHMAGVETNAG